MFKIGSLSDQGWVSDPAATLNYLLTCYLLTDVGQTLLFKGNVTSLSYTYHLYINEPEQMATAVSSDLTTLLERYFAQVQVRCKSKLIEGATYGILIQAIAITQDGERVELSKVMEISTNNLRKIIHANNYGEASDTFNSF